MKQTIKLGTLSAGNIFITFLFQLYVLTQLGPGAGTDALFAGMAVPQLVLAVISGSLMHVLVPLLAGESEERLRHDAWGFLVLITCSFGLLATILYVLAPWWVPLIVPGFDQSGQALTVELTRIQLLGMVFAAMNGVLLATYHARQQFIWAECSPIIASTFALLLLVWLLPHYGVIAAAWISALRMALQTLLLAPGIGKPVRPNLRSPAIKAAWQKIRPLLIGTAYYKTDPLFDRFLLSLASSGSLSLYYIAQQIYGAASQIINKAIVNPLVPRLSNLHKSGDGAGFKTAYRQKLLQVGSISFASLLILGLFGQGVLAALVGHGKVDAGNVSELWWIMIWLGGMFVGSVMGQVSASSFYACGDTSTPTRIGVISYTFYVPTKFAIFYCFGIQGLALTTSIFFLTNFFIQIIEIEKKYK